MKPPITVKYLFIVALTAAGLLAASGAGSAASADGNAHEVSIYIDASRVSPDAWGNEMKAAVENLLALMEILIDGSPDFQIRGQPHENFERFRSYLEERKIRYYIHIDIIPPIGQNKKWLFLTQVKDTKKNWTDEDQWEVLEKAFFNLDENNLDNGAVQTIAKDSAALLQSGLGEKIKRKTFFCACFFTERNAEFLPDPEERTPAERMSFRLRNDILPNNLPVLLKDIEDYLFDFRFMTMFEFNLHCIRGEDPDGLMLKASKADYTLEGRISLQRYDEIAVILTIYDRSQRDIERFVVQNIEDESQWPSAITAIVIEWAKKKAGP